MPVVALPLPPSTTGPRGRKRSIALSQEDVVNVASFGRAKRRADAVVTREAAGAAARRIRETESGSPISAGRDAPGRTSGLVGAGGFEPPIRDPKSRALPLGHAPNFPPSATAGRAPAGDQRRARDRPRRPGAPGPTRQGR